MGSFISAKQQSALTMHYCLLVLALVCLITGQWRAPTFKHDVRVNKMIPAERKYLVLEPGTEMVYEYPTNSGRVYSVQSSEFEQKPRKVHRDEFLTNNINREFLDGPSWVRRKNYFSHNNPK